MKIHCPSHADTNPSMHVYADRAFCFVCGYNCSSDEVTTAEERVTIKHEKSDIIQDILHISALPVKLIRGLMLPYDSSGYYVIWPDKKYYKKRLWDNTSRYVSPRGFSPPLYTFNGSCKRRVLILVEGELNCISLAKSIGTSDTIASPGSAGNFSKYLDYYLTYDCIVAIFDKDAAGLTAGIRLKEELVFRKPTMNLKLIPIERDYNDVLQQEGPEKVKSLFKASVGL